MAEAPTGSALVPHGSSDGEETEELEEVYLVEPRRSTTRVEKYTGTMDNQEWLNLKSTTINAFAHFVVADSACEYLLADLQGMSGLFVLVRISVRANKPCSITGHPGRYCAY